MAAVVTGEVEHGRPETVVGRNKRLFTKKEERSGKGERGETEGQDVTRRNATGRRLRGTGAKPKGYPGVQETRGRTGGKDTPDAKGGKTNGGRRAGKAGADTRSTPPGAGTARSVCAHMGGRE